MVVVAIASGLPAPHNLLQFSLRRAFLNLVNLNERRQKKRGRSGYSLFCYDTFETLSQTRSSQSVVHGYRRKEFLTARVTDEIVTKW